MNEKKRKRIKIGDVYGIPLPNGKFAFGRIFKDGGIAIYKHIGNTINDLPKTEEYQFIVGVYSYVLKSEQWQVVENRPFRNEDDAWPPPCCIIDSISGGYSIYYKGEIKNSCKEKCEGLEVAAVWDSHQIIDRIMGENKWHKR